MQTVLEGERGGYALEKTVAKHKGTEQKAQIDEGHRIKGEDPEKAADKEENSSKDEGQASSDGKDPPEHPYIFYEGFGDEGFRIHTAGPRVDGGQEGMSWRQTGVLADA
jgi:hypothetical protein